ncbi:MAG: hypothetical protein JO057_02855 [Chloroflexi bacterium]|nr:hypothetical protein [Chloroflexota bacterium]
MHVEGLTRPLPPDSAVGELRARLGRLRWRLGLERLAQAALRGLVASSVALIVLSLGLWLAGGNRAALWLAAAPLLAALALAIVRWPSPHQTAVVADRRLGLAERLVTAVELSQSGPSGRFDLVQIRDTLRHVVPAPRAWLAFEARTRIEALIAVVALVLALAAATFVPHVPRPVRTAAPLLADVSASSAADDAAPDRGVPIAATAPDQTAGVPAPPQVGAVPADLASRVQQEQAERVAMDMLAQGLGSVSAGQSAAEAIQQGDFGAAHDQIQSLGDQADQLSDAAKQQLAHGLQQAAASTSQSDRALADREQQAAQALSRSTYVEQRQALNALADQVQRSGSRSVPADQLERDQGQLQQQQLGQPRGSATSTQRGQAANGAQSGASSAAASGVSQNGDPGQQTGSASGGVSQSGNGAADQGGAGAGTGSSPDPFSNAASRLDSAGQQVQVPTRLGPGAGVRPADGTEDQSTDDASLGGQSVAEQAQAQHTGQVIPEQNLVPGEERPVVRDYFR